MSLKYEKSVSLALKSLKDKEFITTIDNRYVLNDLLFNSWLKYKESSFWKVSYFDRLLLNLI